MGLLVNKVWSKYMSWRVSPADGLPSGAGVTGITGASSATSVVATPLLEGKRLRRARAMIPLSL